MAIGKVENPARWLLRIWDQLPDKNNQTNGIWGWAAAFRLEQTDPRTLSAILALHDQAHRARALIAELPYSESCSQKFSGAFFVMSKLLSKPLSSHCGKPR